MDAGRVAVRALFLAAGAAALVFSAPIAWQLAAAAWFLPPALVGAAVFSGNCMLGVWAIFSSQRDNDPLPFLWPGVLLAANAYIATQMVDIEDLVVPRRAAVAGLVLAVLAVGRAAADTVVTAVAEKPRS